MLILIKMLCLVPRWNANANANAASSRPMKSTFPPSIQSFLTTRDVARFNMLCIVYMQMLIFLPLFFFIINERSLKVINQVNELVSLKLLGIIFVIISKYGLR